MARDPGLESVLERPRLELSRIEATFLEDRVHAIKSRPGVSLLAELLDEPTTNAPSLWETALVRSGRASLTLLARDAEQLSNAHHGAMLIYNLLCAGRVNNRAAVEDWSGRCDQWSAAHPAEQWATWDLDAFWRRIAEPDGPRAMPRTRLFVTDLVATLARLHSQGLRGSPARAARPLPRAGHEAGT